MADLIAGAPEVFLQEALCLPRVCDRGQGDGWHNGVYLRSHSLTLPSVWHSNQGDTFLQRDVIGAAAHRNCVHEPRGQSEGLFKLNDQVVCDCSSDMYITKSTTSLRNSFPTFYVGPRSLDLYAVSQLSRPMSLYILSSFATFFNRLY